MMARRSLSACSSRIADEESRRKAERDLMETTMKMRYGEIRRRDKGVPIACDCSAAIRVATSHDPTTRGKLYFGCPYEISAGPGEGCGFKRWWIEALCDEFAKIKEEKDDMEQELELMKDGVVHLMDKFGEMEKKYEALQKKYESLNKYL